MTDREYTLAMIARIRARLAQREDEYDRLILAGWERHLSYIKEDDGEERIDDGLDDFSTIHKGAQQS